MKKECLGFRAVSWEVSHRERERERKRDFSNDDDDKESQTENCCGGTRFCYFFKSVGQSVI